MDDFKPRIVKLVNDLKECIASFGKAPVNVTNAMTWFSFDVMSAVLFGEDFGMISKSAYILVYFTLLCFVPVRQDRTFH
jgi:hypothetical protein